jgi:hypothetical protein
MTFRKLQIAWSVFWGVAGVLLVVLWVRSYWWDDEATFVCSSRTKLLLAVEYGETVAHYEPLLFAGMPRSMLESHSRWLYGVPGVHNRVAFTIEPEHFVVMIPIWFWCVLSTIFAAGPWLSWHFRLRTLLIATTLVALVLGLAGLRG